MSWRRTQRGKKRHNRGEMASDDEIRRRIRKPMPPPTRIEDKRRLEDEWDLEDEWEEWDDS